MAEKVRRKSLSLSIGKTSRKNSLTTSIAESKTEAPDTSEGNAAAEKGRKKSFSLSIGKTSRKNSVASSIAESKTAEAPVVEEEAAEANTETPEGNAGTPEQGNDEPAEGNTATQEVETGPTDAETGETQVIAETPEQSTQTPEPPGTSTTEEIDSGVEAVEQPKERQLITFGGRNVHVKDRFRCVSGVVVSKESEIYIADCYNERIVIYSPEGKFIRQFQTFFKGLFKRKPFQPQDVTIDKYEKVWVVGSLANPKRLGPTDFVVQFTKDGCFISKIEIPHTGTNFHGIAAKPHNLFHREVVVTEDEDDLPPKPDMEIIVTEQRVRPWEGKWYVESCCKVFLPDGKMYKTVLGRTRKARYAAVNGKGDIIATDCWLNKVYISKEEAKDVRFGGKGTENGRLEEPHGVCTDSEDNIIVVDRGNRRVELFDPDGNFIRHIATGMADPWAVAAGPDFLVVTNVGKCGVDTVTVIPYQPPPAPDHELAAAEQSAE